MPVRVAELDTLFTATITDFEAKAQTVERKQLEIDRARTEAEVTAEVDGAMRSLDDVAGELDDLAGADTEVEVEAEVRGATEDLDTVADLLEDLDDEDVQVDVDVDADRARDGLRRAEEGLGDFRDESNQIAKESATSFTGEWEDVSDVFRDLAANAFVGFGPAGIAAGVAVAAGLGIGVKAAQDLAEANTEAKESAAEMATGIADGALDARESFREWATEVREDDAWTFWKDEAETNITAVADSFALLGEAGAQAFSAIADADLGGMNDSLAAMNGELEVLYEKNLAAVESNAVGAMGGLQGVRGETESLTAVERERLEALEEASELLEDEIAKHEEAEEVARALLMVEEDLTEAEADQEIQLRRTNEERERKNDINRTSIETALDLADGLADLTDKEDGWKASLNDGTQAGRDNIREIVDLTEDIEALGEATLEQTGSQDKANAAVRQARDDLLDQAEAAGFNRGKVEDLIETILDVPDEAETTFDADTGPARREGESLVEWINRQSGEIDVDLSADWSASQLNAAIDTMQLNASRRRIFVGTSAVTAQAIGGVVDYFADGAENHVAQIAPAGAWRVWAEPETGGEAYIPLAPSKRDRSMEILAEVADRFGATLTTRANGAVDAPMQASTPSVTPAPVGAPQINVTVHATSSDPNALAAAVSDELAWEYRR